MSSTASVLGFVVGIPLFIFVVIGPMYCVIKIAEFKKLNSALWTFFAIFFSIPAFIVVSLLPSLRSTVEKDTYHGKFTPIHDNFGYTFAAIISMLTIMYFYFRLYTSPLIPALQNPCINIHVPIGLIAYSAGFTSFILCIIRLTQKIPMPRVLLRLQLFAVTMHFLTILSGSIWAQYAWGASWSWDPKETWSIILLSIMINITTYLTIKVPGRTKGLILVTLQLAAIVFVALLDKTLAGLHLYAVLF